MSITNVNKTTNRVPIKMDSNGNEHPIFYEIAKGFSEMSIKNPSTTNTNRYIISNESNNNGNVEISSNNDSYKNITSNDNNGRRKEILSTGRSRSLLSEKKFNFISISSNPINPIENNRTTSSINMSNNPLYINTSNNNNTSSIDQRSTNQNNVISSPSGSTDNTTTTTSNNTIATTNKQQQQQRYIDGVKIPLAKLTSYPVTLFHETVAYTTNETHIKRKCDGCGRYKVRASTSPEVGHYCDDCSLRYFIQCNSCQRRNTTDQFVLKRTVIDQWICKPCNNNFHTYPTIETATTSNQFITEYKNAACIQCKLPNYLSPEIAAVAYKPEDICIVCHVKNLNLQVLKYQYEFNIVLHEFEAYKQFIRDNYKTLLKQEMDNRTYCHLFPMSDHANVDSNDSLDLPPSPLTLDEDDKPNDDLTSHIRFQRCPTIIFDGSQE